MRADMFKLIVERPRWGASHAPSPKLKRKLDPGINKIGLKRHAKIGAPYSKALNENLAPLVRFLRSRRGIRCSAKFAPTSTLAARSRCMCASTLRPMY